MLQTINMFILLLAFLLTFFINFIVLFFNHIYLFYKYTYTNICIDLYKFL